MRGRPPKPVSLKKMQGTYRPDREPVVAVGGGKGMPACPKWLPPEAQREWRRVCREAKAAGRITKLDMSVLAMYCLNWALIQEALAKGHTNQLLQLQRGLMRCAESLGLTPTGRLKLREPVAPVADELEEFLKGG